MGWGAVAGSLVDAFTQGFTAKKQYEKAKYMYKHRYQWTMKDMKKAGLNPILAASGGFSVGNPEPPPANVNGHFAESLGNFSAKNLAIKQAKADIDKTKQDTATSQAQAHAATSQENLNDSLAHGNEIENQKKDLELRAAEKFYQDQVEANIRATNAKAAADRAAADTAGYTGPGGIKIPKAAVDAVKEIIRSYTGNSAKKQEEN